MDKVRLGIIGLGWFGEIHGDAVTGIPEIELAALCTRTESRLGELANKFGVSQTYTDYTEMLANPDIDAVSVVTMWDQHTALVLRNPGKEQRAIALELEAPMLLGEMSQFIQDDSRTATVRVASDASFLKFSWDDLYARAGAELSKEENAAFIQAIEKVVWDRYDLKGLMDLAFLSELSDDLKVRVCLPFPWISKRVKLANNEPLFESAARCKARGYLLIRGRISLIWIGAEEKVVAAPNIIGIMPNNKPERIWSASARANGEAELLAFSWIEYGAKLEERLSNKEMKQFFDSLKNNAKRHFWH